MKFSAPKPQHGWREFAGEVGIIVIGVLIALGAQQVAESARDHRVAEQTRSAVAEEINQQLLSISLRSTAENCLLRRLGELHRLVDQWGEVGDV